MEVFVPGEHSGESGARLVVENMHRNIMAFSISQFISYPSGRSGAFGDDQVRLS